MKHFATKIGVGTWVLDIPVRADRSDLNDWKRDREESAALIFSEVKLGKNNDFSGHKELKEW